MTTTQQPDPKAIVLFREYDITWLSEHTPFSEAYLLSLKNGHQPIREVFRLRVAKALGEPEAVLFAVSEGSDG